MEDDSISISSSRLVMFRSTPFGVDAWHSTGEPARYTGRFHRAGEPFPLYASDCEVATLRELALHTEFPLEPQRMVLRRITALAIAAGSRVLIADHAKTLEATGLTLEQIYSPTDYSGCHALADHARADPAIVAIETQSNADRQRRTIAVLPEHVAHVTALVDYWEGSLNLLKLAFDSARH